MKNSPEDITADQLRKRTAVGDGISAGSASRRLKRLLIHRSYNIPKPKHPSLVCIQTLGGISLLLKDRRAILDSGPGPTINKIIAIRRSYKSV
jgi:hypothetical protein